MSPDELCRRVCSPFSAPISFLERVHLYLGDRINVLAAKGGPPLSPRPPWRFPPEAATCASHPLTKYGCRSLKRRNRIAGSEPVAPAAHSDWRHESAR